MKKSHANVVSLARVEAPPVYNFMWIGSGVLKMRRSLFGLLKMPATLNPVVSVNAFLTVTHAVAIRPFGRTIYSWDLIF
jgi:hypothetical protein